VLQVFSQRVSIASSSCWPEVSRSASNMFLFYLTPVGPRFWFSRSSSNVLLLRLNHTGPRTSGMLPKMFPLLLNPVGLRAPGLLPLCFHGFRIMPASGHLFCSQHVCIVFYSCWSKCVKICSRRVCSAFASCWLEGSRAASHVFPLHCNYVGLNAQALLPARSVAFGLCWPKGLKVFFQHLLDSI
jgi:hypothetical protein